MARLALAAACIAAIPQVAAAATPVADTPVATDSQAAPPTGPDTSTPATDPGATVTPEEPEPVVVVPETPAAEPATPPAATEPPPPATDGAYAPPPVETAPVASAPVPTTTTTPATSPAGTADPIAASKSLPVSGPDAPAPGDVIKATGASVTAVASPSGAGQAPATDRQTLAPAVSGAPDRLVIRNTTGAATPDSRVATDTHSAGAAPAAATTTARRTTHPVPSPDRLGVRLSTDATRPDTVLTGVRTASPTVGRTVSRKAVPSFLEAPTADPATSTRIAAPSFGAGAGTTGSGLLQVLANYVFPGVSNNASGAILLLFPLALLLAALTPRIPRLHLQTIVAERGSGCPGYNPVQLRPG